MRKYLTTLSARSTCYSSSLSLSLSPELFRGSQSFSQLAEVSSNTATEHHLCFPVSESAAKASKTTRSRQAGQLDQLSVAAERFRWQQLSEEEERGGGGKGGGGGGLESCQQFEQFARQGEQPWPLLYPAGFVFKPTAVVNPCTQRLLQSVVKQVPPFRVCRIPGCGNVLNRHR